MKYLVFGLGNIGAEYDDTRHNIGFKTLDSLAEDSSVSFSTVRLGDRAEVKYRGRTLILIKPSTYMNLSGKAVTYWMKQESVPVERVLIVTDDLALPFGKQRLRNKGSDGGHNGLKSIIGSLGRSDFARLRFGIGDEFHKGQQVNYVLSKWSDEEMKTLPERIDVAKKTILAFSFLPVSQVMSEFNSK
jgi:PTH1 family peptidyl-tRNA hydrolase